MRSWCSPIAISALLLAGPAHSAPPERVEIAYDLLHDGARIAVIVDRLEHDGRHYEIDERWQGKGLLALRGEARRSSRGVVGPHGLQPYAFADRRSGRRTARATFDWQARELTLQYKGEPQRVPMPPNAQDRLSFLYGFAFALPGEQAATFHVADGRGVSESVYRVVGRERLTLPAGEFETLKLVKRKDDPSDRGTEIWLAERWGWLPVRVLVIESDGTRLDQVATRVAIP